MYSCKMSNNNLSSNNLMNYNNINFFTEVTSMINQQVTVPVSEMVHHLRRYHQLWYTDLGDFCVSYDMFTQELTTTQCSEIMFRSIVSFFEESHKTMAESCLWLMKTSRNANYYHHNQLSTLGWHRASSFDLIFNMHRHASNYNDDDSDNEPDFC